MICDIKSWDATSLPRSLWTVKFVDYSPFPILRSLLSSITKLSKIVKKRKLKHCIRRGGRLRDSESFWISLRAFPQALRMTLFLFPLPWKRASKTLSFWSYSWSYLVKDHIKASIRWIRFVSSVSVLIMKTTLSMILKKCFFMFISARSPQPSIPSM